MIIVYTTASIIGGAATVALGGQHSLLLGVLAAPLGGSLVALATALFALRRSSRTQTAPPDVIWC